ncbi:MAG: hypothetical protein AB8G99_27025 [Planctomycetaceae bacterium]
MTDRRVELPIRATLYPVDLLRAEVVGQVTKLCRECCRDRLA